ncbi:complement factor H-related protein 1-like isoform X2 [Elgaria multicarinata webbii]|uniref:complement factor H-related protein 1-like isoform X2 n=1 Tax=Elgaria multicarinata webbii TaxID=159646 RepID=UPI002FCD32E8
MKSWLVFIVPFLLWQCCTSQSVCEEPPDIEFGIILSDEKAEYRESDRVQYKCNPGYSFEGSEWIICSGQQWSPPPKCLAPCGISKQQLDGKHLLLSGGRRRSQFIQNGQILEFLCRDGYVLTPPPVRKCIDGHMDLPLCISERGKNCSRPPIIQNGDIITLSQKQYASGSSVEFQCQRYYAMEGHNSSFCDNGNWTKAPICLEPCALSLAEMESQNIEVKGRSDESGSQNTYLQRGNSVELTCKSGYALAATSPQSSIEIQCDGKPIVYPECKEITCNPPKVANGTFRPQRNVYHGGDIILIECDSVQGEGGLKIAECTRNGWSPSHMCTVGCDYPIIESGRLDAYYEDRRVNNIPVLLGHPVQFRCNRGFLTSNGYESIRVQCTRSGWNPEPKCLIPCTATEEDMRRNNIRLKWKRNEKVYTESGDEIEFSCVSGYRSDPTFQAPFRAQCRDGKLEYPRCIR